MSIQRNDNGTYWWAREDDLTASRWAPKSAPSPPNTRHKTPAAAAAARHASAVVSGGSGAGPMARNPKRSRRESRAAVGFSRGLESSCWASPNRANTPILTPNDLGSMHPDRAFRFNTGSNPSANPAAGNKTGSKKNKAVGSLSVDTHPPHPLKAPLGRRASAEDRVDVLMGEPTPVSPRKYLCKPSRSRAIAC